MTRQDTCERNTRRGSAKSETPSHDDLVGRSHLWFDFSHDIVCTLFSASLHCKYFLVMVSVFVDLYMYSCESRSVGLMVILIFMIDLQGQERSK